MTGLCWWRSFLNPGERFVGYTYAYNATGAMTQMNGLKGTGTAWNLAFDYPFTNALSDVYSSVTKTVNGGAPVVTESFYDAFGRRRAKRNAIGDGQEFLYDLGHQLLVDSIWSPEPLLQSPHFVRVLARRGASLPAYGYAASNPVFYFDPTGLDPKKTYGSEDEAGKAALQWIRDTKTPSQLRLREYCGQVRRTKDGKFRHDELTAGPPRSETRATCASGSKADDSVGPFHSHPWTSDFSDDDIELCNDRQSPCYLLGPDGKMFKYSPTIIPGTVPTVDRSVKNITPLGNTRPY